MSGDETRPGIRDRKRDHIALCVEEDVEFRRKTTLLEEIELIHDSLPELSTDDVDLSTVVLGKRLRAPIVITGMTGGVDEAVELNRCLADVAERHGLGFGLGSQRPMLDSDEVGAGYHVRDVAPTALILGNIGAVQAARCSSAELGELIDGVGADALAIHLNPGQELIQPEGDRDFRGCIEAIRRLREELHVPVIVKETGCGLGPPALSKLRATGVEWVDVSGAGGTTWIGVESRRATGSAGAVGENLWDWGTPTAVAAICAVRSGFSVVASGGLRSGLDAVRALSLGARAAGLALPLLRAFHDGGPPAVDEAVAQLLREVRAVMCLTGCPDLDALHRAPKVLGPRLRSWLDQL